MKKIEKRNKIRISYQFEILNILRKGKRTITELADSLNISFTAISHILEELEAEKIILTSNKNRSKKRGRYPAYVELNCDDGVVCSVDFSFFDVRVVIASLQSEIIIEETIPGVKYLNKETLGQVEACIKDLLKKPEVTNRKLLSICIACPGLIRPKDYEIVFSRRLSDLNIIHPVLYFTNAFNVSVEMHNDVRIGCLAELKVGAFPKKLNNGLFIVIGPYAGLALVINGKIYQGSNGFSGETPVYVGDDDIVANSRWNSRFYSILEIERDIRSNKNTQLPDQDELINVKQLIENYKKGDKETVAAVEESAKRNAITIFGLATILDIDYIVIGGEILEFGSQYLDLIRRDIDEFSSSEIRTRILASSLNNEYSTIGSCYQATSIYFLEAIEALTKKRFNLSEFALGEEYRDI